MDSHVDVLVAGGGSAGLAAAVAAARAGAKTLLIERLGSLGGMTTSSLVHSICGLYRLSETSTPVVGHDGFAAEFARRLTEMGGATAPARMGKVDVLLTRPPLISRVADLFCEEEPLLQVRFHTELYAAHLKGDGLLNRVDLYCRGTRNSIIAKAFVDATGDAQLSWLAGAPCEQSDILQRPAYIFSMGSVDTQSLNATGRLRLAQRIITAIRNGELPEALTGAHFRPLTLSQPEAGEVYITLDLGDPDDHPFDPISPESLSKIESYGRRLAFQLAQFLVKEIAAFRFAYITALPTRVGIRESRRIVGEFRLESEHILAGATFPDAVALSHWPIEIRETPSGPRLRFPKGNKPCEVPLRALRPKGFTNLFTAGRCLSSSHTAQAALRVVATCMATGEAAGRAAALVAKGEEPTAESINALRYLHSQYTQSGTNELG